MYHNKVTTSVLLHVAGVTALLVHEARNDRPDGRLSLEVGQLPPFPDHVLKDNAMPNRQAAKSDQGETEGRPGAGQILLLSNWSGLLNN
jgi:hypothetical protein